MTERVETVARAIYEEAHERPWSRERDFDVRDYYRRLAAAAIAGMPPAEEAVKRVEALADEWKADAVDGQVWLPRTLVLTRIRAALASPAPAPQDSDGNGSGDWMGGPIG